MEEELTRQRVSLPDGDIQLLQPGQWADLPDDAGFEWAPLAPYWAVLWRSGVALATALADRELDGLRVLELGCGLAIPSLAAARGGADVLATDYEREPVELVESNAALNDLSLRTSVVDFTSGPAAFAGEGRFDLVLGADLLYEEEAPEALIELLPRLAPEALIASPARAPFERFMSSLSPDWAVERTEAGVVTVVRIRFDS